ncbi:MAG: hypothetical protein KAG91_01520 [Mycoplasmataceae bacterium]|nr:hypothetical protein [Mycoplasmataceae bacterium]
MKKLLLGLGSIAAVAAPIAAVVSCGDEATPNVKPGKVITTTTAEKAASDAAAKAVFGASAGATTLEGGVKIHVFNEEDFTLSFTVKQGEKTKKIVLTHIEKPKAGELSETVTIDGLAGLPANAKLSIDAFGNISSISTEVQRQLKLNDPKEQMKLSREDAIKKLNAHYPNKQLTASELDLISKALTIEDLVKATTKITTDRANAPVVATTPSTLFTSMTTGATLSDEDSEAKGTLIKTGKTAVSVTTTQALVDAFKTLVETHTEEERVYFAPNPALKALIATLTSSTATKTTATSLSTKTETVASLKDSLHSTTANFADSGFYADVLPSNPKVMLFSEVVSATSVRYLFKITLV